MDYQSRKHIRNPKHDYSKSGIYFITTTTRGSACLFGEVKSNGPLLNNLGNTVRTCWLDIPNHFPTVETDEFIVMPNHIHGILHINNIPEINSFPDTMFPYRYYCPNQFGAQKKASLGIVIGQFKSAVTRWAINNGQGGIFDWLPRFNDRIIRNNDELIAIRKYIQNNPAKWIEKYGTSE